MPSTFENLAIPDNAAAVTPNDSTDLTNKGILYVGGAGNVSVVTAGGDTVTFSGVAAGTFLPVMVARVRSTNTTATLILVLY
jgi:hypothetical protein